MHELRLLEWKNMPERDLTHSESSPDGRFVTTRWTVISTAARSTDSPEAHRALESLCRSYWFPLYAFLRQRGYNKDQAEDFTQGFFVHLLDRHGLQHVKPGKYRFRSYLLAALNNFVIDDWRQKQRPKRGGDRRILSLNLEDAEHRYNLEPVDDLTPERLFDRSWALTVIRRALDALQAEYQSAGKQRLFEILKDRITPNPDAGSYREAARKLGVSEGVVRVTVHRMRVRLGDLIRAEVAETVSSPQQLEDEIGQLFAALNKP
jgi:RNA polymerase sigma-70 factor (ECF subfamily)